MFSDGVVFLDYFVISFAISSSLFNVNLFFCVVGWFKFGKNRTLKSPTNVPASEIRFHFTATILAISVTGICGAFFRMIGNCQKKKLNMETNHLAHLCLHVKNVSRHCRLHFAKLAGEWQQLRFTQARKKHNSLLAPLDSSSFVALVLLRRRSHRHWCLC